MDLKVTANYINQFDSRCNISTPRTAESSRGPISYLADTLTARHTIFSKDVIISSSPLPGAKEEKLIFLKD